MQTTIYIWIPVKIWTLTQANGVWEQSTGENAWIWNNNKQEHDENA
jgi:hypothetical protein